VNEMGNGYNDSCLIIIIFTGTLVAVKR